MRALGIDLGSKRIGVAVSDSGGAVATPITTIMRSRRRDDDHLAVAALVAEWQAEAVVVGLPLSLDGTMGPAAHAVLDEVDQLRAAITVPIDTVDERFTTVTATEQLRRQGVSGPKRAAVVDQVAAAVLLQAWLEQRSPETPSGCAAPGDDDA
jgi:putative holliday junction resolvase